MANPVTVEEYRDRQVEIRSRLDEIDREFTGKRFSDEAETEWNDLNEEYERNVDTIDQLEQRRARVAELAGEPDDQRGGLRGAGSERGATFHTNAGRTRGDDIWDLSTVRSNVADPTQAARELNDRAKDAIERAHIPHDDADEARAKEHVERLLVRAQTPEGAEGVVARHILQTGSPTYMRAFGKYLASTPLTAEEARALSIGTPGGGGYAVPYTLDPTIIPTSNGSVNPLRAMARVVTIAGSNEWQGVSSGGITASRVGEAEEATDNSPTLAQPSARVTRVDAFVPFSIEVDADWPALQSEMAMLLQDAKDDEEAVSFVRGDGTGNNPEGLLTGATNTVDTVGSGAFAVGDVYALLEALPPRFRPRGQWLANLSIYDKVRQFDTAGGASLWKRLGEGLTQGNTGADLIGRPAWEASSMSSSVRAGELILAFGDFRYFTIVDRIGMTVELIPHLFGTARNFPTGQRGLLAYWRNTSVVLSANGFRVLRVRS